MLLRAAIRYVRAARGAPVFAASRQRAKSAYAGALMLERALW